MSTVSREKIQIYSTSYFKDRIYSNKNKFLICGQYPAENQYQKYLLLCNFQKTIYRVQPNLRQYSSSSKI